LGIVAASVYHHAMIIESEVLSNNWQNYQVANYM